MSANTSLTPREYGAYAEFAFPLLTGLVAGGVTLAGVAFGVAALAGFLASEPLAVLAGARGTRRREQASVLARRRLIALGAAGVTAGGAALLTAPPAARLAALAPAGCALALLPALLRGRHKTLAAELLVAAALAAMTLPVGVAGGMPPRIAALASGVWLSTFWLATLTVHAIKARFKPGLGAGWARWAAPAFATAVAGLAAAGFLLRTIPPAAALAVLPAALVAAAALASGVTPRRLRRVGWSLVAANATTFALLTLA